MHWQHCVKCGCRRAVTEETLILASASPRRRELLAQVYPHFRVIPATLPEPTRRSPHVPPDQWATALAYFKARSVAQHYPDCWVLGADTLVVCDGQILGKPRDSDDARRMLDLQARRVSEVLTGLCLLRRVPQQRRFLAVDRTRVWMRDDAPAREDYLRSGDWAGKAGAYGIQDVGDRLVERIEGSFSNVVGLPVELVARMLRQAGLSVPETAAHPDG